MICLFVAENKKVESLIILQRISVILVVVLSFSHMRRDSVGLLFPAHAAVSRIKQRGNLNLHETLIHKIQSKTNNKQAELRWRGILMRLQLKLRQWAASIKACRTAQQLQIRQLSLGFRALAYCHLHTTVSPSVENMAPKSSLTGNQVCVWAAGAVQVRHRYTNGL